MINWIKKLPGLLLWVLLLFSRETSPAQTIKILTSGEKTSIRGLSVVSELFKNSDDTNIQLLVKLMETVDETFESIKNINGINVEEDENGS